jgi:hypothetical protein
MISPAPAVIRLSRAMPKSGGLRRRHRDEKTMKFYARMMDASTGGEGAYEFDGPENLFSKTADEIVTAFFEHIENDVLKHHADWEINGVMKNKERSVVTALGSLTPSENDAPLPFMVMISRAR